MDEFKKFLMELYTTRAISIIKDLIEYWKIPYITLKDVFSIAYSENGAYKYLRENYNYNFPPLVYEKFRERFPLSEELSEGFKEVILMSNLDRQIRELSSLISMKEALSLSKYSKLRKDMNLQELLKILDEELEEMSKDNEY
ncbi:MAG: hypothetical protein RQ930_01740 [Candidatus Aenigmarchaeota archaeon]|nr:hypothetical protein [Candidatus Aenigmarchaeota archaeon]